MPNVIEITDFAAPELDVYARLTQAQLRSRLEPEKGIFIAESPKVIARALDAGYQPISFLMERKQITGPASEVLARSGNAPVYTADRAMLAQLTGFELTRGVLCAMHRPLLPTVAEVCRNARRVAVLEGIVDSTNIGAIFRSAAALNMDAVLVTPSCCDPLCRRAVRVSMGTVFQVPWTQIGSTAADWPEQGMQQLHDLGFKITVVPAHTTAEEVLAMNPDGIFLSNGPGDPADVPEIVEEVKKLIGKKPIFGICLGHQLLALAMGAKTYKLKFGHRGTNQPVKDLRTGNVYISSQNHGYAVDEASLKDLPLTVTHINVNDGTVEGMRHETLPIFSVQYHPEAAPGPDDNMYLFDEFWAMLKKGE